MTKKCNVNFSENAYVVLSYLAMKHGKNKGEMLAEILALAKYIDEKQDADWTFLIERGREIKEISWSW